MKAILLLSGGLDSTLVAEMMAKEGIDLLAVNYKTPFCQCDKHSAHGCAHTALAVAGRLGIECRVINAGEDFLKIVENPKHGYGSNMNPCQDCRILFFKKAKEIMEDVGAGFIITGEVVGQRPMSQQKRQLNIIERESGLKGLVVRPLSAKILPVTIPEEKGWIKRENLLAISGRSRKPQAALAKKFGLNDYPCAAGGCLLTEPSFARRVKDLKDHGPFDMPNVNLLKVGRHYRLSTKVKLVVGRDEKENEFLLQIAKPKDYIFKAANVPGPVALGRGDFSKEQIEFSAKAISRYVGPNGLSPVEIAYSFAQENTPMFIQALPASEEVLKQYRI